MEFVYSVYYKTNCRICPAVYTKKDLKKMRPFHFISCARRIFPFAARVCLVLQLLNELCHRGGSVEIIGNQIVDVDVDVEGIVQLADQRDDVK